MNVLVWMLCLGFVVIRYVVILMGLMLLLNLNVVVILL